MPPKKKPRPEAAAKQTFLSTLHSQLKAADVARIARRGRVASRRLTRFQYERTVNELLGIDIPLRDFLPVDPRMDGFDTVAAAQQVSHHLLGKYLEAADAALDSAFSRAMNPRPDHRVMLDWKKLRRNEKRRNSREPAGRPGHQDVVAWSTQQPFYGRMPATRVPASGWYRVRLKVTAVNPPKEGRVWCSARSGVCYARASTLYWVGSFAATKKPREYEYLAWIKKGHMLEIRPKDRKLKQAGGRDTKGHVNGPADFLERSGHPGVAIKWIEMKRVCPGGGPEMVREKLFGGHNPDALTGEDLAGLLRAFSGRAFRRPVSKDEAAPYLSLALVELKAGASPIEALRGAYRGVLSSPRFLYFDEALGPLGEHALAARLSYFLWSTSPDEELRSLADKGQLLKPEIMHQQVERMLDDPKAKTLVENFTDQWLNLVDIDFTTPDAKLYPEFDEVLKHSMLEETRTFFHELLKNDLSVSNIVDSKFGFMNARLARHYRVPWPGGEGMQRVSFKPGDHRGGIITHGSVLKVTADGTTTSPVIRGVWMMERIMGYHVPPPPANVPPVEPDIRGATTILEQLAKHRTMPSCAVCHVKIDPPGVALESYDVIGGWRTHYRAAINPKKRGWKKGPAVDPSYVTADGDAFADVDAFKEILVRKPELIARNVANHLVTYATGASISFSDREHIEAIVAASAKHGFGLKTLIHEVVKSRLFTHK